MNVAILCEYSNTVASEFRKNGHHVLSCDLIESEGPSEFHSVVDVFEFVNNLSNIGLIIGHPPCTALCVSGNGTYGSGKSKNYMRHDAIKWTNDLWILCKKKSKKVCFENPVGVINLGVKPQYVQPYKFGHLEQKKTGLHLHNLPKLMDTNNVYEEMMKLPKKDREKTFYTSPSVTRGKERSRFFSGIAKAMADQWGGLCFM